MVYLIIKTVAACILFFCGSFFFFSNPWMFWRDLTSYMFFFPIIFFAGMILVCLYMSVLMGSMDKTSIIHSDRYDYAYKIVFTITFLLLLIRLILGDFANLCTSECLDPCEIHYRGGISLSVEMIVIIILAMASGLATWLTPKIKDNDTTDF